jgi:hypothetical protein
MGSKFVSLYVCDANQVERRVGSGDLAYLKTLDLDAEEVPLVQRLLRREYQRDPETKESPEGTKLIYAFERICAKEAVQQTSLEVYVDEDLTPELWALVTADWSIPDRLELPLSEYATNSVVYLDPKDLLPHREALAARERAGDTDEECFPPESLRECLALLDVALGKAFGVYVFFSE